MTKLSKLTRERFARRLSGIVRHCIKRTVVDSLEGHNKAVDAVAAGYLETDGRVFWATAKGIAMLKDDRDLNARRDCFDEDGQYLSSEGWSSKSIGITDPSQAIDWIAAAIEVDFKNMIGAGDSMSGRSKYTVLDGDAEIASDSVEWAKHVANKDTSPLRDD